MKDRFGANFLRRREIISFRDESSSERRSFSLMDRRKKEKKKFWADKETIKKRLSSALNLEFSGRCFDDGDESAAAQFPKLRQDSRTAS